MINFIYIGRFYIGDSIWRDYDIMNNFNEFEFNEKSQSYSLGSPIHYNSKINLTYSPSQDVIPMTSPRSAFISSTEQMSKQLIEAITQERASFVKRCDDIKRDLSNLLSQIE